MEENKVLLDQSKISDFLKQNNNWSLKNDGVECNLEFNNYMDSISFINKLAIKAEELNHHPDLIVGWCEVSVSFTSHDKGGVTSACLKMAKTVEEL